MKIESIVLTFGLIVSAPVPCKEFDRNLVPDKKTALKVASAVMESYLGEKKFKKDLKLRGLDAIEQGDTWIVCHCLYSGKVVTINEDSITMPRPLGIEVIISKKNGEILDLYYAR